ncbi:cell surface domain protein [Bacillus cereus]|nr:cell surface domain protein [Bacillus cereus]
MIVTEFWINEAPAPSPSVKTVALAGILPVFVTAIV